LQADIQKMIERAETVTGYKVSIGSGTGFTGFARMITVTPQRPSHAITINQHYSNIGDYIVALQCAMLLIKWSDPKKIPVFMVDDEKAGANPQTRKPPMRPNNYPCSIPPRTWIKTAHPDFITAPPKCGSPGKV